MSATKTHSVLTIAVTQIALACVVQTLHAATPASTPAASSSQERAVVLKPTSQADADLMLRQARSAIENGRLDEAEKILTRIESCARQLLGLPCRPHAGIGSPRADQGSALFGRHEQADRKASCQNRRATPLLSRHQRKDEFSR